MHGSDSIAESGQPNRTISPNLSQSPFSVKIDNAFHQDADCSAPRPSHCRVDIAIAQVWRISSVHVRSGRPCYSRRVLVAPGSARLAPSEAPPPVSALDPRRSTNCCAHIMTNRTMKISAMGQDSFDLATTAAPRDQASFRAARGKSPTNRAIVAGAGALSCELGSEESNEFSLSVAAGAGRLLKLAASRQGSRSSRASAESTLSNIPFGSSPIAANRNGSNA